MLAEKYTANAGKIQNLLTKVSQKAGETSKFVQRVSKMNGAGFIQALVWGCMQKAECSLENLATASRRCGVPITDSGVDQRIDAEAVVLVQEVMQKSIAQLAGQERLDLAGLAHFSAFYLTDSTQVTLPEHMRDVFPGIGADAPAAAAKIQLNYEYLSGTLRAIQVQAATQPDQTCDLPLQQAEPGSLNTFDLGYFRQELFDDLADKGAFFISRFAHQTALYTDEAEPLRVELLAYLKTIHGDQHQVWLQMGRKVHVRVRVLFQRLPPAVAEERRRKAKARMKDKGKQPSQTYLELLEWQFFITNVPEEWLSFEQILLLYRVRWQVELVFKLWKSQAGIDRLGHWRRDRLLVQIYARLIGLVIFFALSAPFRWLDGSELSLPKAFATFQEKIPALLRAISRGWHAFAAVLKRLYAHWCRYDRKTHRVKHPSTLQALEATMS
jgi:hypothetical protein